MSTVLLMTAACSPHGARGPINSDAAGLGFTADMVTTVGKATSTSRIAVRDGVLRMEVQNGRRSSTMIVRYDQDNVRVLIPSEGRYAEFPVCSLGDQLPHFFKPGLKAAKEYLGEEPVTGRQARKFRTNITDGEEKEYHGLLWEAVDLPGYPLQWEDESRGISAIWRNSRIAPVPKSLFDIPAGFTLLSAGKEEAAGRENRCVKRRAKDPAAGPAGAAGDQ